LLLNWGKAEVRILMGDITEQRVDAIVNAANSSLMGGGGVDGAIHRRGGPRILEECTTIRREQWPDGMPSGKAAITTGGRLPARYVIHTVGPVWRGGNAGEAGILADCYRNSLELARAKGLRSIAFPSVSTGAYGYPIWEASLVALSPVKRFAEEGGEPSQISLVLFSQEDMKVYEETAAALSGPPKKSES